MCSASFEITAADAALFNERGYHTPRRCRACRANIRTTNERKAGSCLCGMQNHRHGDCKTLPLVE